MFTEACVSCCLPDPLALSPPPCSLSAYEYSLMPAAPEQLNLDLCMLYLGSMQWHCTVQHHTVLYPLILWLHIAMLVPHSRQGRCAVSGRNLKFVTPSSAAMCCCCTICDPYTVLSCDRLPMLHISMCAFRISEACTRTPCALDLSHPPSSSPHRSNLNLSHLHLYLLLHSLLLVVSCSCIPAA